MDVTSLIAWSGGTLGAIVVGLQVVLFFAAMRALRRCTGFYNSQLASVNRLARERGRRCDDNEALNSLLDDFDGLVSESPRGPNVSSLVSRHIGNDRWLALPKCGTLTRFTVRPAFVKFVATSLIGLGLFGTFWGLRSSLDGVSQSLYGMTDQARMAAEITENYAETDSVVANILNTISRPLDGMNTAFTTSLVGLGLSLVLSFLQAGWFNYSAVRQEFVQELDTYLDSHYMALISMDGEKKMPAMMQRLEEAAGKIADGLSARVDSGFIKVGEELHVATSSLASMATHMSSLIASFGESSRRISDVSATLDQWIKATDRSVEAMSSLIDRSSQESARLVASVNSVVGPIQQFSAAAGEFVEHMATVEYSVQDAGQEILGLLTSSVADFRRVAASSENVMAQVAAKLDELPAVMASTGASAITESLKPAISSMVREMENAQRVVEQSWHTLHQYEAMVPSLGEIAGQAFGTHMSDAIAAALDVITVTHEDAVTDIIDTARAVSNSLVAPVDNQLKHLSTAIDDMTKANRKLVGSMSQLFMLDDATLSATAEGKQVESMLSSDIA